MLRDTRRSAAGKSARRGWVPPPRPGKHAAPARAQGEYSARVRSASVGISRSQSDDGSQAAEQSALEGQPGGSRRLPASEASPQPVRTLQGGTVRRPGEGTPEPDG